MGMATCRWRVHLYPALAPPIFPRKSLVSVPSVWAVCDHLAVQPLLMIPAGSRNWPGRGRGLPSTPLPRQRSGTLALQRSELLYFKQLLNLLVSVFIFFLTLEAAGPEKEDEHLDCLNLPIAQGFPPSASLVGRQRERAEEETASSLLSARFSFHQAIKAGGGHLDGRFVRPLGQRKLQLRLLPSSSFPRSSSEERRGNRAEEGLGALVEESEREATAASRRLQMMPHSFPFKSMSRAGEINICVTIPVGNERLFLEGGCQTEVAEASAARCRDCCVCWVRSHSQLEQAAAPLEGSPHRELKFGLGQESRAGSSTWRRGLGRWGTEPAWSPHPAGAQPLPSALLPFSPS